MSILKGLGMLLGAGVGTLAGNPALGAGIGGTLFGGIEDAAKKPKKAAPPKPWLGSEVSLQHQNPWQAQSAPMIPEAPQYADFELPRRRTNGDDEEEIRRKMALAAAGRLA